MLKLTEKLKEREDYLQNIEVETIKEIQKRDRNI